MTLSIGWGVIATILSQPLPPGGLLAVVVLLMVVGMLSFGITSIRTAVSPKSVGLLLLALATVWIVWLAGVAGLYGEIPEWSSFAFGVVLTILTLAIGYRLQTEGTNARRVPAANTG